MPTAAHVLLRSREEALEHARRRLLPGGAQGRRAGGGQGRDHLRRPRRRRATAVEVFFTERRFGETTVVLEEFLEGEELSLLALCDGENVVPLAPAQDYKRIFDGDEGPNTGGMGSYSPVPGFGPAEVEEIVDAVHRPVVAAMARRGAPFHGVLYAGLMIGPDGPKVLEFNARFGDPETQAVLPRLRSDLLELCLAAREPGGLAGVEAEFGEDWAVTLVLASAGYPESSSKGDVIRGLDAAAELAEVTHAGTAARDGEIVTAGGRVLNVTALGPTPAAARDRAYDAAGRISFDGMQIRSDIAARAVERVAELKRTSQDSQRGSDERDLRGAAGRAARPRCPRSRRRSRRSRSTSPSSGSSWARRTTSRRCSRPGAALHEAGIRYEVRVMSAHRDPELVREYCHERADARPAR